MQIKSVKENSADKKGKEVKSAEKKASNAEEKKSTEPKKTEKYSDSANGYNKTFENGKRSFRRNDDFARIYV